MSEYTCDFCDKAVERKNLTFAMTPRPSDPLELVCVMWACTECGTKAGFKTWDDIEKIEREIEEGKSPYLFITLL
jgi:hypothetical protein